MSVARDRSAFWLPDRQTYATEQERDRHLEALYAFGEYTIFILMWRIVDHEAGLVGRCPNCYVGFGKIAETYKQPSDSFCEECYGSSFEGGYRARVVRPALWDDTKDSHVAGQARGEVILSRATIQTTADVYLRTNDYAFRADGSRWQVKAGSEVSLQTGFHFTEPAMSSVGYIFADVAREDESAPVFTIPPTVAEQRALLRVEGQRRPTSFATWEDIKPGVVLGEEG